MLDDIKKEETGFTSDEVSWQIEERPINSQNREWLWALAIIGFAIIFFSVMLKNYLLIVITALAAFIIYASKNKNPELHHFLLNNEGLYIDEKFYSYKNFESFWIFQEKDIALRRKHRLMPLLIIPFHGEEEPNIRKIISDHMPESEEEESFLDLLQKKFF